jgi:hypothetical protein
MNHEEPPSRLPEGERESPSIVASDELRRIFADEIAIAIIEITKTREDIQRVDRNTAPWVAFLIGFLAAVAGGLAIEEARRHIDWEKVLDTIRHESAS